MSGPANLPLGVGAGLSLMVVAAALVSLVWTPWPTEAVATDLRLQAPSLAHPFGTDHFGRDVLSLTLAGAQTSLAVALLAVLIGAGLGVPLGLLAAAREGGWIDDLVSRAQDILFAFPALVLALLLTAVLGPDALNAILAIGLFNVPVFARLARAGALALWARPFVTAARALGKGRTRISIQHILPNLTDLLVVQATIQFALGIVAEAGLSFVGLGAQPPTASWGRMLYEGQTLMWIAPWTVIFPGAAIAISVLGFNLLGDGLRAALDPRSRVREAGV